MSPILSTPLELRNALGDELERNAFDTVSVLAARQHGVIARWQLIALGCDEWWVDRQLSYGYLHLLEQGVYAVGHPAVSRRGRAVIALLRAGEGSALSHESAARLWEIVETANDGPIHVSLGRRRGIESTESIEVHRPRKLGADDIVMHRGVWVTTPERTLRDLMPHRSVEELTRLLEQMVTVLGRSPDDLHAWAPALRGQPGFAKLTEALDHVVGPTVIRSELESRFRTLCQHAGLPMPETNVRIAPWEVDVLWRRLGVVVELDSWRFHGGKWQFYRDRKKGLALNRAGYELVRVTWPQVKYESAEVVETLRLVLQRAERRVALEALHGATLA